MDYEGICLIAREWSTGSTVGNAKCGWGDLILFRSKIDRLVPQTEHVNLKIVCQFALRPQPQRLEPRAWLKIRPESGLDWRICSF